MVVMDPHSTALEAMCGIPVEMLTAVPVLASALARECSSDAVVVAPDLGAVKLAEHYASLLERLVAVVRKTRVSGAAVRAEQLAGDVAGRPAVISDDSLPQGHPPAPAMKTESMAPLLADAIGRLHRDQPLGDLLART